LKASIATEHLSKMKYKHNSTIGFSVWICILITSFSAPLRAALPSPVGSWSFDDLATNNLRDKSAPLLGQIHGYCDLAAGVSGQALSFDGFTGFIECAPDRAPRLTGAFAVQAWLALGAYPWNWCPLAAQLDGTEAGYFFGINDAGRLSLQLAAGGQWHTVASDDVLSLRRWYHVAGVYDPAQGMTIYIDGKAVASKKLEQEFTAASSKPLLIGKHPEPLLPTGGIRKNSHSRADVLFDGLLDELAIFAQPLTAKQIAATYQRHRPSPSPDLPPRVLPAGPSTTNSFGAFYANLKYYPAWDRLWRVGDYPDVVVCFDQMPGRLVFWRGTSYIPQWVTENGIWYNNEFNETWGHGAIGCAEPMSDKQCRHSHVRIIENTPARAVVHWRYALIDNRYHFARVDPTTGWGDWTDEIHTVYPDGVAVRQITLHSSQPAEPHEWHEGMIVMGPGQHPEGVLEPAGLTLANLSGETHTYSWKDKTPPKHPDQPAQACIQVFNTKSTLRPFAAARPVDQPAFDIYAGEIRREVSIYPWWNHWPTAFHPSDGRWAVAADRASHSSLTHISWKAYAQGDNWMTKIMLTGLTDQAPEATVTLVRSWAQPAALHLKSDAFTSQGYDPAQRAYVLTCKQPNNTASLEFALHASDTNPLVNPAFIVKQWARQQVELRFNGERMKAPTDYRYGTRSSLESNDLVLWLKKSTTKGASVVITAQR